MHFNWLHFTDLHCGMREDRWLWDTVHERLRKDLAILQPRCGPWDLILFTGDLTDRGTRAQFDELDARLTRLGDCIAAGQDGRQPILLAVPGNHDLQRPPSDDVGLNVLAGWTNQPRLRKTFWDNPKSDMRKTVDTAFAEYCAWWERRVLPQKGTNGLIELTRGAQLPGDFSATLERDGCRLGLLGLNTAALQLTAEDYEHRLALHSLQFSAACGAGGLDWAQRHHACLLMSHHPPTWLDTESRAHLEGQITDDGRFAVHLCGHLHEPYRLRSAVNANPEKFLFQGRSLFGLEHYGGQQQRLHGYTAGRIHMGGDQAGTLTLWPRRGELSGGELRINVDSNDLPVEATDTGPIPFKLPRPCGGAVSAVPMPQATPTGAAPVPVAAGCATGAIPAVPAPGSAPLPLSPPLDDAFARALAKIIDQTLAVPAALLLREALRTGLAGPGGTTGERLCALGQEGAVTVLFGALVACLRQSPRGEGGRCGLAMSRSLVGASPTWVVVSREPSIEPCGTHGNGRVDV